MLILDTFLIGLSSGAIYSLMALALVLVWRSTRVVNFAQAGQAILSTYLGYEVMNRTHSYWISVPFAVLAGAAVAAVVFFDHAAAVRAGCVQRGVVAGDGVAVVFLGLLHHAAGHLGNVLHEGFAGEQAFFHLREFELPVASQFSA